MTGRVRLAGIAGGDGPGRAERLAHYGCADSPGHRAGVMAFINERPPRALR